MKQFTDQPQIKNDRHPDAGVDELFLKRWSPRAFRDEPIEQDTLRTLFEAARWSPSCANEQPWKFIVASTPAERDFFVTLLAEGNQVWCKDAPVLGFVLARRRFEKSGEPNAWARFDTGAAWMAFTVQARLLGLYTHGMAGIKTEEIYKSLNLSKDDLDVIAAFAIGALGDPSQLPEHLQGREKPSDRKRLEEVVKFYTLKDKD